MRILKEKPTFLLWVLLAVLILNPLHLFIPGYVPPGGDTRAHLFRISGFHGEFIENTGLSLRQYNGVVLLNYGPLFYALAYAIFILSDPVTAYNVLRVAVISLYLSSVYHFSLKYSLDKRRAIIASLIAGLFPTMWIVYYNGVYPYLLSWSFTLLSAALVLSTSRTPRDPYSLIASSVLCSLSVLSHIYGLLNAVLPLLVIFTQKHYSLLERLQRAIAFSLITVGCSLGYLYAVVTTYAYSSPLYELSPLPGTPRIQYNSLCIDITLVSLITVYLAVSISSLLRRHSEIYSSLADVAMLVFTLVSLLPIIVPALLPSYSRLIHQFTLFIIPWRFLYVNNVSLLAIYISSRIRNFTSREKLFYICLLGSILTSIAGAVLTTHVYMSYELDISTAYPGFTSTVRGRRVLVTEPVLSWPNSPVAFSLIYNYSTSTGSYNQGDPAFFDLTVYYEWIRGLVTNPVVAKNVLELSWSKFLLTTTPVDIDLYTKYAEIPLTKCNVEELANTLVFTCMLEKPIKLTEFTGLKILTLTNSTSQIRNATFILESGVEIPLEMVQSSQNLVVFQQMRRNEGYVTGLKIHAGATSLDSILSIEIGELLLRRVSVYSYKGYNVFLYEYIGDPKPVLCSKIVLIDHGSLQPQIINLFAEDGYKAILIDVSAVKHSIKYIEPFVSGVIVDSEEKAERYTGNSSLKVVVLKYGLKFKITPVNSNLLVIESPIVKPDILPRDPGNLYTYTSWDSRVSSKWIEELVNESSLLWSYIKSFFNLDEKPCNAIVNFNPPFIEVDINYEGYVALVKVAYTPYWRSNTVYTKSACGLIVVIPVSSTNKLYLKWNPPFIREAYVVSVATALVVIPYLIAGYKSAKCAATSTSPRSRLVEGILST
jgi:uncharacterized membrane protein